MYKLLALGKDNKLHCCNVNNKEVSCCEEKIAIKQINPDISKLQKIGLQIFWCYECSDLLDQQENNQN